MTYTTISSKPNKYLVHWQCSPTEWQTFGKLYWTVKIPWLYPVFLIVIFSLWLILFSEKVYENIFNGDEILKEIFSAASFFCVCIGIIIYGIKRLKSECIFYRKLRTEPVNIYIDRDRVTIGNREYQLGRSIIEDRCRLVMGKEGKISLLIFRVLRYRKAG